MKHQFALWVGCVFMLPLLAFAQSPRQPNILLILLDDMGYNDLGINNQSDAPTTRLNRFAQQGVRFTRHYADSTCSPSRLAILTGKSPSETAQPAQFLGISPETVTLAETLQHAGYQTQHIGKWHIGDMVRGAWPSAQGFDHWFGFLNQFLLQPSQNPQQLYQPSHSYHDPWLASDTHERRVFPGHLTQILTDYTVDTLETLVQSSKPWFVNLWFFAPHEPIQPHRDYAQQYPDTPQGRYYALLHQVDDAIGRILDSLDKTRQANNTLVVILSDNGGTNNALDNNAPFFGTKVTFYEGGLRTPLLMRWPGVFPQGRVIDSVVSEIDIYPTLAKAANADMPADLDGLALQPMIFSPDPVQFNRSLFWELAAQNYYARSILSADGEWRLVNKALFKLTEDPTGATDVAQKYPRKYRELSATYAQWQREASKAEVRFERLTPATGKLYGDSYHRTPGPGGFSFAVGVTPAALDEKPQALVQHSGIWSMSLSQQGLSVQVGDVRLQTEALPVGTCSSVVFSSYFNQAKLNHKNRIAYYRLYINGELKADYQQPFGYESPDTYQQPSLLGHGENMATFNGSLSEPQVYNSYLGMQPAEHISGFWTRLPAPDFPSSEDFLRDLHHAVCPLNAVRYPPELPAK